jgi:hypothetical protein
VFTETHEGKEGTCMNYRDDDDDLPVVTDEQLEQSLTKTRPYTVLILKAGPKFEMPGPDRTSGVTKIVWEHGKRNSALRLAGLMPIVCPIGDGSGVTGIGIFDASPDDVERIMSGDPAVRAGVFTYEVHSARSFPGSTLPG